MSPILYTASEGACSFCCFDCLATTLGLSKPASVAPAASIEANSSIHVASTGIAAEATHANAQASVQVTGSNPTLQIHASAQAVHTVAEGKRATNHEASQEAGKQSPNNEASQEGGKQSTNHPALQEGDKQSTNHGALQEGDKQSTNHRALQEGDKQSTNHGALQEGDKQSTNHGAYQAEGDTLVDPPHATDVVQMELEKLYEKDCEVPSPAKPRSLDMDAALATESASTTPASIENVGRLQDLSSLIQGMLQRPGTVDIEEVLAQANMLAGPRQAATVPASANEPQPSLDLPKEQPAASTGPDLAKEQPTTASAGPDLAKERTASTGPDLPKEQPTASTGPDLAKELQSTTVPRHRISSKQSPHREATATATAPTPEAMPAARNGKRDRSQETEEERLRREGHNSYMRFYRSLRPQAAK